MAIALIDTNILIDYFDGVPQAAIELDYYNDLAISSVTYMEFVIGLRKQVASGLLTPTELSALVLAVKDLTIIHIDEDISERSIEVRSNSLLGPGPRMKLPDAIIFATAAIGGRYMVTRDPGGFAGPNVRLPYQITPLGAVINVNPHPPS
jgi:predicted nucleic acid-binding protein